MSSTIAVMAALQLATNAFSLPPGLLNALCTVESNLRPTAIHKHDGDSDSHGLCQIKEATAKQFRPYVTAKDLMNPKINAIVAAMYLHYQYERYGSWEAAVVAYNRGNAVGIASSRYQRKVFKVWKELQ